MTLFDFLLRIGGGFCSLFLVLVFFGELDTASRFLQAMWGGEPRKLKAENKRLKKELQSVKLLVENDLETRVGTLETIVTDADRALEDRFRRL